MSETRTCRERLAPFCQGNGLDIGSGGDPIVPWAISVDRRRPGHLPAQQPIHLVGDAAHLVWFADGTLDFIYSSHCLEDFEDTAAAINEWLRVLKPGGVLVLFLPDQKTFMSVNLARGGDLNSDHKHADFSLAFILKLCGRPPLKYPVAVIHQLWPVPNNGYSFDLVLKKLP